MRFIYSWIDGNIYIDKYRSIEIRALGYHQKGQYWYMQIWTKEGGYKSKWITEVTMRKTRKDFPTIKLVDGKYEDT